MLYPLAVVNGRSTRLPNELTQANGEEIIDVEKMILNTEDPPEDICKHAQSQILSEVSRKDMKEFMESFNEIVQKAVSKDDQFFLFLHKSSFRLFSSDKFPLQLLFAGCLLQVL